MIDLVDRLAELILQQLGYAKHVVNRCCKLVISLLKTKRNTILTVLS